MSAFNLDSVCTIEHLNIRKDSRSDDAVVAVDVKLSCETDGPRVLQAILGADSETQVLMSFWEPVEQNPRFSGIERMESWACFEGRHSVRFGSNRTRASKVGKFKFKPTANQLIELEFSVTVSQPETSLLAALAAAVKDEVRVMVLADPDLLDDQGGSRGAPSDPGGDGDTQAPIGGEQALQGLREAPEAEGAKRIADCMSLVAQTVPQIVMEVDPDSLFTCPNHPGGLRLTEQACAKSWQKHSGRDFRGHPCHRCSIGAKSAGKDPVPVEAGASCCYCDRPQGEMRMMFGVLCVSCYNRLREVSVGRDRKGNVPGLSRRLKSYEVVIHDDQQASSANSGACA